MVKALINGKNWEQFICGSKGSIRLSLKPMAKSKWYEGSANGKVYFQMCGKKEAVQEFNKLVEQAHEIVQ